VIALHEIPRKLLGKGTELTRLLPGVQGRELSRYRALEADLLRLPTAGARPAHPGLPLPPAPVIREALRAEPDYRLIDIDNPEPGDADLLARHRLDPSGIRANRGLIPSEALDTPRDRPSSDPDRTAFQLEAITEAAVEAVCPVTGRLRRAIHGLLAAENQPIFYWFAPDGDAPAMFLATGREGRGWIKLYLYLPALRVALLLADPTRWHGRDELDELRAYLIAEHRRIRRYLGCTRRPQPWLLIDNQQFAHNLWNALGGLERLVAHPDASDSCRRGQRHRRALGAGGCVVPGTRPVAHRTRRRTRADGPGHGGAPAADPPRRHPRHRRPGRAGKGPRAAAGTGPAASAATGAA
jgi:hypothetical protein